MTSTTGLFQFDPYKMGEPIPAHASLTTDPLGQVVAVITAWLPEGTGSSGYDWQKTAYLRADFVKEKVDLVWTIDGELSLEGEWDLQVADDDVREYLFLWADEEPDEDSFAVLASQAAELKIVPPDAGIRSFWASPDFDGGAPSEDWTGVPDEA